MVKLEYTKYAFNLPTLLDEDNYIFFKTLLKQDEKYTFNAPSEFYKIFLTEIIIFILGIIGFSITVQNYKRFISWIGNILCLGLFIAFSLIPSLFYGLFK